MRAFPGRSARCAPALLAMLNLPGSGLLEAAAFTPYLDPLFPRLLGEAPLLEGVTAETALPSHAPFVNGAMLESRPLMFRLFAWHDGQGWQVLPGGLGFGIAEPLAAGPAGIKDLWVLEAEEPLFIAGAAPAEPPEHRAFLAAEHLPSRVADNLFWLGRSVERLEAAARLLMLALPRLESGTSLPRDAAERVLITRCLAQAGLLPAEPPVAPSPAGCCAARWRDANRSPGC